MCSEPAFRGLAPAGLAAATGRNHVTADTNFAPLPIGSKARQATPASLSGTPVHQTDRAPFLPFEGQGRAHGEYSMATRMLIDARHPEETRVAVLQGNRIEEFDFESAEHKQIKGNIYLAKVTRVEPSLQAAFVDFGGNRHGFLAFSEIHPDYYQIPKADRDALLAEEAEAAEEEARLRAEEEEEGIAPGDEYDAEDDSGESLAEDLAEDGLEEIDTSGADQVSTIEDGDGRRRWQ
jgi:hypothetical protein